jgi:hypothetical protein
MVQIEWLSDSIWTAASLMNVLNRPSSINFIEFLHRTAFQHIFRSRPILFRSLQEDGTQHNFEKQLIQLIQFFNCSRSQSGSWSFLMITRIEYLCVPRSSELHRAPQLVHIRPRDMGIHLWAPNCLSFSLWFRWNDAARPQPLVGSYPGITSSDSPTPTIFHPFHFHFHFHFHPVNDFVRVKSPRFRSRTRPDSSGP